MDKRQVMLIHWMYNFAITQMANDPIFIKEDQKFLKESVKQRFPKHAEEITKKFDVEFFERGAKRANKKVKEKEQDSWEL